MEYARSVQILVFFLCGLLGSNAARKIGGPRWIYQGDAAKYTCPRPSYGTVREVNWTFGSRMIFKNNIRNSRSQVYESKYSNELRVDKAASHGLDLVVQNVSIAANRGRLSCDVTIGGRRYRTFSHSTILNVTAGEEPHIRVYADSIDKHMAAITCQVPYWKEFRGLYVDAEKIAADRLESLEPAGGTRFELNLTQFVRNRGGILTVECGSSEEGGYPGFTYHKFRISPTPEGGHQLWLDMLDTATMSHAGSLAGSTLLLATLILLLQASHLPESEI